MVGVGRELGGTYQKAVGTFSRSHSATLHTRPNQNPGGLLRNIDGGLGAKVVHTMHISEE